MKRILCICLVAAVVVLSQSAAFAAGLRAAWNFEDGAPGGVTADVSGIAPAMNATGQGTYTVTTDPDRSGKVLDPTAGLFDGSGHPLASGGFLANSQSKTEGVWGSFTLSLWVKPQADDVTGSVNWAVNEQWKLLAGRTNGSGPRMMSMSSGLLFASDLLNPNTTWEPVQVWRGSNWDPADGTYDGTGPWHHLLITFDGDKFKCWVDGLNHLVQDTNSTNISANAGNWGIAWVTAATTAMKIDDVAWFNGYIDDANVIALYNGTKTIYNVTVKNPTAGISAPPADKLAYWYRMDEAVGAYTNLRDYSENSGPAVKVDNSTVTPVGIVNDADRFRALGMNYNTAYRYDTAKIDQTVNSFFMYREKVTMTWWAKTYNNPDGGALMITTEGNGIGVDRWGGGVRVFLDIDYHEPNSTEDHIRFGPQAGWGTISDGEWHHFAMVFDGNLPAGYVLSDPNTHDANAVGEIYIDGILVGRDKSVPCGALWSADEPMWLFCNTSTAVNGDGTRGMIDDVRKYNAALTSEQVRYIYQTTNHVYEGLDVVTAYSEAPNTDDSEQWQINQITNDIRWNPGKGATSHNVYFRKKGDAWPAAVNQAACSYDPAGDMLLNTVYEWKVDEVTGSTIIPGNTWKFKTVNYMVLDDFETYTSSGNLQATWKTTGNANSPSLVVTATGGDISRLDQGAQAVKMLNISLSTSPYRAMYYKTLSTAINLSAANQNIASLRIKYQGESANVSAPMCAYLKDSTGNVAIVTNPNSNAYRALYWTDWNIALSTFKAANSSLNLASITEYGVGMGSGTAGSSAMGNMSFDSIRVYPPRCLAAMNKADTNGDCKVDIQDVNALASDWLDTGYTAGKLVALYRFEGNANDESGYTPTANGALVGSGVSIGADTAPARSGQVLTSSGVHGNYVKCNVSSGKIQDKFNFYGGGTVVAWVKPVGAVSTGWDFIVGAGDFGPRMWQFPNYKIKFGMTMEPPDWANSNFDLTADLLAANTWTHVACVYDPIALRMYIYINGTPFVNKPCSPNQAAAVQRYYTIGNDINSTSTGFKGKIDDVAIYNRALTSSEVTAVKNATNVAGFQVATVAFYVPITSPGNAYPEALNVDVVNFKDYSVISDRWLENPSLWP